MHNRIHLLYFEAGTPRDGAVYVALVDLFDAAHFGAPISAVDAVTYIYDVRENTEREELRGRSTVGGGG